MHRVLVNARISGQSKKVRAQGFFKAIDWPFDLMVGDTFYYDPAPASKGAKILRRQHFQAGNHGVKVPVLMLEIRVSRREYKRLAVMRGWYSTPGDAAFSRDLD